MDRVANHKLVYALLDQRTPKGEYRYGEFCFEHEPFYVGKGDKSRPYQHARLALKFPERITFKNNKIRSIFADTGEKPVINIIAFDLADEDAKSLERNLLAEIGTYLEERKGPLTNVVLEPDYIPPPPSGDKHYTKDPLKAKAAHQKKVANLGYKYLSHTKEGVSRMSLRVANGTAHFLGATNPTKLRSLNEDPKLVCPWLNSASNERSRLGWFLRRELEALAKENPTLGYRKFAKVANQELKILDIYGFVLDENMPYKIAYYKKWTPKKLQLWEEWKSSYNPKT